MTCDTYLSMLATLPVGELAYADAREHAAACPDCNRVTRVVIERERNMIMAFGELYPPVPAGPLAARAIVLSRRRRIALYYRLGLGVITAVTIFFLIALRLKLPAAGGVVSQTFRLQCLSPDQAAEVLRPIISPSVSVSMRANSQLGMITVAALPRDLQRVRSVLDRYDRPTESQCGVQLTVPKSIKVP